MRINILLLLLFSLLYSKVASSQTTEEITAIISTVISQENDQTGNVGEESVTYENEYNLLASKSFIFYKRFISSQDASQCSFTPSCSVYAIQAIKKQGFIPGMLNFFDRFSRCNSLTPENYSKDPHNHLLIDPVRDIHYETIH